MSAPLHPSTSHHDRRSRGNKKHDQIGPSLGMKKSSSLESLQTMVQEIVIQEDMKSGYVPSRSGPQTVKVVRGRGCNESFRQAVDRSYEAPLSGLENQMETCMWNSRSIICFTTIHDLYCFPLYYPVVAEEETESGLSSPPASGRNRMELEAENDDKARSTKKKAGLFRGLGSMFRFGRHRKPHASGGKGGDNEGQEKGGHYGSNIDPIQVLF